jgi:hypothetical protein
MSSRTNQIRPELSGVNRRIKRVLLILFLGSANFLQTAVKYSVNKKIHRAHLKGYSNGLDAI